MLIRVGNLVQGTTEDELRSAFEHFGKVGKSIIGVNSRTNTVCDYGFVEMDSREEGQAALDGMVTRRIKGRQVTVSEIGVRPQPAVSYMKLKLDPAKFIVPSESKKAKAKAPKRAKKPKVAAAVKPS